MGRKVRKLILTKGQKRLLSMSIKMQGIWKETWQSPKKMIFNLVYPTIQLIHPQKQKDQRGEKKTQSGQLSPARYGIFYSWVQVEKLSSCVFYYLQHFIPTFLMTRSPYAFAYHPNCQDMSCQEGCCNYYGQCPSYYSYSSDPDQYECWYYYDYYSPNYPCKTYYPGLLGVMIEGTVGGVALICLCIIIVMLCRRGKDSGMGDQQSFDNLRPAENMIMQDRSRSQTDGSSVHPSSDPKQY